jgi:intein/homing endonuclease
LKPIDEIKVGDWVLSAPEDGSGKPEYKRVVNTLVFRNKTIRHLGYRDPKKGTVTIAATGNHPFWVEGVGWTHADQLKDGDPIRLADGNLSTIAYQDPVYRFRDEPGIGWRTAGNPWLINPASGILFDYENYEVLEHQRGELDWEEMTEENYLEVTVYNLEVEDFHTYYVGGAGVWVHNA